MTIAQFRLIPSNVSRMREILDDPTFATAVVTLRDSQIPVDVTDFSPEVASVRSLSRMAGYADCLNDLLSLSSPAPSPAEDIPEDWGVEVKQS